MPGETVLDKLVTVLAFNTDLAGLRRFDDKVRNTRKRLDGLSSAGFNVGRQLTVVGGVATGVFGLAVKQAVEWESDFTGIRKTVNGTEEEFAALDKRLREMSRIEVPVPVGELAKLAEIGGQLGIGIDEMPEFVKVMADLGVATNLTSDEAAIGLARLANNTTMTKEEFDNAGSSIAQLGNDFATSEPQILAFARRIAGAGNLIGLTTAEILGLSAGVSAVGIGPEAGGTAFSRIFVSMHEAVQTGNEDLDTFGELTGRAGGEFAGMFKADPKQAILAFVDGMGRITDEGGNVHAVLEELGFDNVRVRDLILLMAGAGDKLTDTVDTSTKAWDENIALTREAELRYGTMASRFQFAKNRANDLAIEIGGVLAPIITDLVDRLEPLIARVSEFVEANPGAIKWLAGLAAALVAIGGGLIAIGAAMKAASLLLGLVQGIGALISGVALIGIGPFLLVIGALVGGAILIIKYWDEIKAFFAGFWEGFVSETNGIQEAFGRIRDEIMRVVDALGLFGEAETGAAAKAQTAGQRVGEAFGVAFLTILDAVGLIIGAVADLINLFFGLIDVLTIVNDAVLEWFDRMEASAFNAGRSMLQAFTDGFVSAKDEMMTAITGVLQDARDLLPFSDAKEGPLADLTASGRAIVDTLKTGIRQAGDIGLPLVDALLPVGPAPQAAGGGGGGPTQLTITIDRIEIIANGGDPEQIAAGVEDALARQVRALVEEADTRVRV